MSNWYTERIEDCDDEDTSSYLYPDDSYSFLSDHVQAQCLVLVGAEQNDGEVLMAFAVTWMNIEYNEWI